MVDVCFTGFDGRNLFLTLFTWNLRKIFRAHLAAGKEKKSMYQKYN